MVTANFNTQQIIWQALDKACQTHQQSFELPSDVPLSICVACSGGLDSVVLLHAAELWSRQSGNPQIRIIHVNHQLSSNAGDWQSHVQALSERLGVRLIVEKVVVTPARRESLEAKARDERYGAFARRLDEQSLILLAHHMDDQVETVLIRLFRGSGPDGLAAMRFYNQRQINGRPLGFARPLLDLSRSDLEHYASEYQLSWVEDESNQDTRFDRNRIRHQLWPQVQALWPERWQGIRRAIARSASLSANNQQTLDFLLAEKLSHVLLAPTIVSRDKLTQLPHTVMVDLLRYWLRTNGAGTPSKTTMDNILLALNVGPDNKVEVSWGEHEIRVFSDGIFYLETPYRALELDEEISESSIVTVQDACNGKRNLVFELHDQQWSVRLLDHVIQLPEFFALGGVRVRNLRRSERFKMHHNRPERKMTYWFKEWRVPPWHRDSTIGVFDRDTLLAVTDGERLMLNKTADGLGD